MVEWSWREIIWERWHYCSRSVYTYKWIGNEALIVLFVVEQLASCCFFKNFATIFFFLWMSLTDRQIMLWYTVKTFIYNYLQTSFSALILPVCRSKHLQKNIKEKVRHNSKKKYCSLHCFLEENQHHWWDKISKSTMQELDLISSCNIINWTTSYEHIRYGVFHRIIGYLSWKGKMWLNLLNSNNNVNGFLFIN